MNCDKCVHNEVCALKSNGQYLEHLVEKQEIDYKDAFEVTCNKFKKPEKPVIFPDFNTPIPRSNDRDRNIYYGKEVTCETKCACGSSSCSDCSDTCGSCLAAPSENRPYEN